MARNAKPLVGFNCETECDGICLRLWWCKANRSVITRKVSISKFRLHHAKRLFLRRSDGRKISGRIWPFLREKSSSLRVHSQTYERMIRFTPEIFIAKDHCWLTRASHLGGDSRSLPFAELLSIAVRIFRMTLNLLVRMFFILLIFSDFFFLREFPVFSCLVRCDCAGMKIQGPTEKFLLRVFIHKFRAFRWHLLPRSPFFVLGSGPRFSTWFSLVIQSADRNCASHFRHPPMQRRNFQIRKKFSRVTFLRLRATQHRFVACALGAWLFEWIFWNSGASFASESVIAMLIKRMHFWWRFSKVFTQLTRVF